MSDKHPNPHHQQAPVHDSEEAKPGLDSLAPDDQEWRPTPKPTAPGAEPTAPGSLKAPDTHSSKLDALEPQRKGGEDYPLTTNQGVRIADDQNSLRAGIAAQRCWKILFCGRRSPTSTMSEFRSVSFMPAAQRPTVTSSPTKA